MTFLILKSPIRFLSEIPAFLPACAFLLLAFLAFCPSSLAQNLQPQPVARLITDPGGDARNSRPRKVTLGDAPATSAGFGAAVSPSFADATSIERHAFEKTNQARVENGLSPLVWDATLCRMARIHSEKMARLGFFSHQTPEGLQLKDRAHAIGLHFRVIGENIAYNKGYADPGTFAVEKWLISSGHRANILYVGFQASAIGSYVSADGSVYLTQVFINR